MKQLLTLTLLTIMVLATTRAKAADQTIVDSRTPVPLPPPARNMPEPEHPAANIFSFLPTLVTPRGKFNLKLDRS